MRLEMIDHESRQGLLVLVVAGVLATGAHAGNPNFDQGVRDVRADAVAVFGNAPEVGTTRTIPAASPGTAAPGPAGQNWGWDPECHEIRIVVSSRGDYDFGDWCTIRGVRFASFTGRPAPKPVQYEDCGKYRHSGFSEWWHGTNDLHDCQHRNADTARRAEREIPPMYLTLDQDRWVTEDESGSRAVVDALQRAASVDIRVRAQCYASRYDAQDNGGTQPPTVYPCRGDGRFIKEVQIGAIR